MRSTLPPFFNPDVEGLPRGDLEALIEERVRYTVQYAADHSPFYRNWFQIHGIAAADIKTHEQLLSLPIISGRNIRQHQPPITSDFEFLSASPHDIFTIHETSGTSGTAKSFFLTWDDWERYSTKYTRFFRSQGFGSGDRVLMCASYGMNVGANTMTLAARNIGMTIIPEGRCFPRGAELIKKYKPTGIVASVFKLLRLARQLKEKGINPRDTGVKTLVIGGESFAEEARQYLVESWECPAYNTYGSTEGTMCGECTALQGLHVPEDLVHVDIYDPKYGRYVPDGECGRIILTTLLPPGSKCGTLLLNYDTDDTSVVLSRVKCACGRTHIRIINPQRESETAWVAGTPFNRVDIENGVFQRENLDYLTGEYEAFLRDDGSNTVLHINLEASNPRECNASIIEENILRPFFKNHPPLAQLYADGTFKITLSFLPIGKLELSPQKGRPKRFQDQRQGGKKCTPVRGS